MNATRYVIDPGPAARTAKNSPPDRVSLTTHMSSQETLIMSSPRGHVTPTYPPVLAGTYPASGGADRNDPDSLPALPYPPTTGSGDPEPLIVHAPEWELIKVRAVVFANELRRIFLRVGVAAEATHLDIRRPVATGTHGGES